MDWPWETFFAATAQVSVTAFVVLVATLSISSSLISGDPRVRSPLKLAAAGTALLKLLVPFLAAMVALMPGHPWRVGYWVMGGAGVAGLILHAAVYERHTDDADRFDAQQFWLGSTVSLGVYVWILAATTADEAWSLTVVAALSVWLLFSGSVEAILLLVQGRKTISTALPRPARPLPPGPPA
ncbi:hypothetical protein [Blastococcus sp. URHD0036]|uniref:hypothetical protein n=1 Tax=Blastococcus sp. URHD0036 TaxID=1380356 RepID=UPI00049732A5|nr:hypothetical protein [Blastococcus sp. URHD0036]